METAIAIGLVIAAIYFVVRIFIKSVNSRDGCNCSGTCHSCPSATKDDQEKKQ